MRRKSLFNNYHIQIYFVIFLHKMEVFFESLVKPVKPMITNHFFIGLILNI